MNTLPKQTTARFFRTETGYAQLKARWSALLAEDRRRAEKIRKARKQNSDIDPGQVDPQVLDSVHHLLYAILRGKDWRKGFTPCTNPVKRDNGVQTWAGATVAIRRLHSRHTETNLLSPMADLLTAETLSLIRTLVPQGENYDWQPDLSHRDAYENLAPAPMAEATVVGW